MLWYWWSVALGAKPLPVQVGPENMLEMKGSDALSMLRYDIWHYAKGRSRCFSTTMGVKNDALYRSMTCRQCFWQEFSETEDSFVFIRHFEEVGIYVGYYILQGGKHQDDRGWTWTKFQPHQSSCRFLRKVWYLSPSTLVEATSSWPAMLGGWACTSLP